MTVIISAQAQLICIPGEAPYQIREFVPKTTYPNTNLPTGDIVIPSGRAFKIASTEGLTTSKLSDATADASHTPSPYGVGMHDLVGALAGPLITPPGFTPTSPSGVGDSIRAAFFSFFDDRVSSQGSNTYPTFVDAASGWSSDLDAVMGNIMLRKQFGAAPLWKLEFPWHVDAWSGKGDVHNGRFFDFETTWFWDGGDTAQNTSAFLNYYKPQSAQGEPNVYDQIIEIAVTNQLTSQLLPNPGSSQKATDILNQIRNGTFSYDESYFDATFVLNKPFLERAYKESISQRFGAGGISTPVRVQAHYNFYLAPYENIIKDLVIQQHSQAGMYQGALFQHPTELVLPNLYAIMVDAGVPYDEFKRYKHADNWQYANKRMFPETGANLDAIDSWETTVTFPFYAALAGAKFHWALSRPVGAPNSLPSSHASTPGVDTHNEYLNTFAIRLKETADAPMEGDTSLSSLAGPLGGKFKRPKYATTGISAHKIKDFMDEADRIKKFFPMHVDLEIPAANKGELGKILYDSNIFDIFMQLMMAALHPKHREDSRAPVTETAIVKRDSYIKDWANTPGIDLQQLENYLYYEPLITLWLDELFKQDSMPDIDSYARTRSDDNASMPQGYGLSKGAIAGAPGPLSPNAALGMSPIAGPEVIDTIKKLNPIFKAKTVGGNEPSKHWIIKPPVFGKKKPSPVNWISNIKWAINKGKINKLIKEKTRSVSDIYSGKLAHSEVLFYEIVKFRQSPTGGTVKNAAAEDWKGPEFIQNIFLPNTPEMDVLRYVDTQVKFGEEYYYQVYAHTFVVGTQYQIRNPPSVTEDLKLLPYGSEMPFDKFVFDYKFTPSARLMRVPYYNTYVTMHDATRKGRPDPTVPWSHSQFPRKLEHTPIWDKPPVFPDITFLPLYGERDKILINSNFNVGEYDLVPEIIDETETENEAIIRRNQKKVKKGTKITYRGDDFCGQIEVLRVDKKPLAWSDFKDSKIATLGGTAHFGKILEQEPNKEYYYTARAIDKHGNYSNPSPIYQVVIISKVGEAPYAIINMFFIDETEEKKPVKRKNLMKYIRIQPSFDQSFLDSSKITNEFKGSDGGVEAFKNSGLLENYLGKSPAHTVFGKEFKFRFISKKTGKKFDLNLQVDKPGFTAVENKTTKGEQDNYSSGKC